MEKSKRLSFRMCEVCNEVEYLTEEQIISGLSSLVDKIDNYCYILHDKDVKEDLTPKANHYHIFLKFNNNVDFSTVAKAFGQKVNFVKKIIAGSYNSAIPYLIHKNSPEKYQYNPEEVKANFDYKKFIEDLDNKKSKTKRLDEIREGIEKGQIRRYNLDEFVTMKEYYTYQRAIESYFKYRDFVMSKKPINKKCIFIHGSSGSGKTYFAKEWAKKQGLSYCVSSSSNDPLQDYRGQDVLILDDLRASSFSFSDLLKLLDNNTNTTVKSRYFNKLLECEYIIITSVIDIDEFYRNLFESENEPIIQLKRRCSVYIECNLKEIDIYSYSKECNDYIYGSTIPNLCPFIDSNNIDNEYDTEQRKIIDSFSSVYPKTNISLGAELPKISEADITLFKSILDGTYDFKKSS